jgi:hypothetical protein
MNAAIIPPAKLAAFDVALTPHIRIGPSKIYTGPYAGNYAINTDILNSCPEWKAQTAAAEALITAQGVLIVVDLDPAALIDPSQPIPVKPT